MLTRKSCTVSTLNELLEEEYVFYKSELISNKAVKNFTIGEAQKALRKGEFRYAFPAESAETRFSDEDVLRAERQLGLERTIENRDAIIDILSKYDRGHLDVEDVIDEYENDPGY